MTPEQRRTARRERLKKLSPNETHPENPLDETVSVDVTPPGPRPQQSFTDRVLTGLKKSGEDAKAKPKPVVDKKQSEKSLQFFKQVLPMTLAAMLASYSAQLFKEPYKPCAPTKQEVEGILLPTFNLISRYIEVTGAASQNSLDIAAALLASLTMGARMLITLTEIKNYEQSKRTSSTSESGPNSNAGVTGSHSSSPTSGTIEPNAYSRGYDGVATAAAISTVLDDDTNGPITDRDREALQIAQLLKRDTQGRRQMGLAPRLIRADDE